MGTKGLLKRVFPGGNTAKGFYSYYHNIIDGDAERIFIMKGGPGVGKSSFMKKTGYTFLENGYAVEFHHCSSDSNSLDAIVIPELKIAIIDGTKPHIVDPKYPGAVDEIIYFGQFWDEKGLKENKKEIIKINTNLEKLYKRTYRFLGAAKLIRDDIEAIYEEALDKGRYNRMITKLRAELLGGVPYSSKEGKKRELFGSAYSPEGFIDYYETIIGSMQKIVHIKGSYIKGISDMMGHMVDEVIKKGLFVEVYHEPLVETNIETIIIPELSLGVTLSPKYEKNNWKAIDFDDLLNKEILAVYMDKLKEDQILLEDLIARGLTNIGMAKKEHDLLEKCYIPHMNFQEIDGLRDNIIIKIMEYAKARLEKSKQ